MVRTFAEECAELLDAAVPELELAARPDRGPFEQRRCFAFQGPCPSLGGGRLSVTVTSREIAVEFLGARNTLANPHEAVALIRGLYDESVVVETWFPTAGPGQCAFTRVDCLPPLPFSLPGVARIRRRSWRGTQDIDVDVS